MATITHTTTTTDKIQSLIAEHGSSWEPNRHESVRQAIREILETEFPGFGEEFLTDWLFTLNPLRSLEWFIGVKKQALAHPKPHHEFFHREFRPVWEKIKADFPDYPTIAAATSLACFETNDKREILFEKSTVEDYKRYLRVWQWCLENGVDHHRWFAYWRVNKVPDNECEIYPGCIIR